MIPLVLRFLHLVLHLATSAGIAVGIFHLPTKSKLYSSIVKEGYVKDMERMGDLYQAIHIRAMIWMAFEMIFCISSIVMLTCSVINIIVKKSPPGFIARIQTWFSENCPNFSFFYYVLLSLFVLYGTMHGCNIPMLFNKHSVTLRPFKKPFDTWQFFLIGAVICGVSNAIFYFVAAFFPLNVISNRKNAAEEATNIPSHNKLSEKELAKQEMNESTKNLADADEN